MAKEEPKLSKLQKKQIEFCEVVRELDRTKEYITKVQLKANILTVEINKLEGK